MGLLIIFLTLFYTVSLSDAAPLQLNFNSQAVEKAQESLRAGQSALQAGLPSIADPFFRDVLEAQAAQDLEPLARLGLIDSLIARRRFQAARSNLKQLHGALTPEKCLREAIVAYGLGEKEASERLLESLKPESLSISDRSFVYLLQGLQKLKQGLPMAAEPLLKMAYDNAALPAQKAWIDVAIADAARQKGPIDNILLKELQSKAETYSKLPSGLAAYQEYAIALAASGKVDEALDTLEIQLKKLPKKSFGDQAQLLLLMNSLAPDTSRGEKALERLMDPRYTGTPQHRALYRIASQTPPENLEKLLNKLLDTPETHPLAGELYIMRAELAIQKNQLDRAEAEAQKALIKAPDLKGTILQVLALISWNRHQYKTAIDYLTQARQETGDESLKAEITAWIGDCYFSSEDFALASVAYKEALPALRSESQERIVYQAVLSLIQEGKLEAAAQLLDTQPVGGDIRWMAEWNLAHALRLKDQIPQARQRIKALKESLSSPMTLNFRLMWLDAWLAFENQNYLEATALSAHLEATLESLPADTLLLDEYEMFLSETYLIEAESFMKLMSFAEATKALLTLRTRFPTSPASMRSFLIEARTKAGQGQTVEAQQRLLELADNYPQSIYSPIALYEAAVLAQNRGLAQSTQEAITLLERIVRDYTASDLVLPARMMQGTLLCRLGDFSTAELLYRTLLNSTLTPETRFTIMLGQANCLMAQASQAPAKWDEAAAILERLFDQSQISNSLRYEAGYKWAFSLEAQKNLPRAQSIYWQLIEKALFDPIHGDSTQSYWVSRALFSLAAILETQDKLPEAQRLYQIVMDQQLPGSALAQTKLSNLDI